MNRFRNVSLCTLLFLLGCSSGPTVTLDQIQQKRVFAIPKENTFEAIRFFTLRDGFIVDSVEDETGRFFAHRVIAGRGMQGGRTIIMNVHVAAVDAGHTEVLTRFTYSQLAQTLSKEEEGILVDCYLQLYRTLEDAAQ